MSDLKQMLKDLNIDKKTVANYLNIKPDSIRFDDRMTKRTWELLVRVESIYKRKGKRWFFIPNKKIGIKRPIDLIKELRLEALEGELDD